VDSKSILRGRIDSLARELGQAEAALERIPPDPLYGAYLQDRARLKRGLLQQRAELIDVSARLEASHPLAECWPAFSAIRTACDLLFGECLVVAIGPLVRQHNLDEGLCRVADVLLERLSIRMGIVWRRRTTLAESEFIGDLAQIVRVRFPVTSVWDLPVAAHEFGHFVGLDLEREGPLRQLLERESADYRAPNWLREHFADTFATYTLGPAFACTCLLLRLDPMADPNAGFATHPSDALRAYAVLRVLEMMDEGSELGREFDGVRLFLEERWQKCKREVAPAGTDIDAGNKARLDRWLAILYPLITDKYPDAKYAGWARARALAKDLARGNDPTPAVLSAEDGIADVLNAAWCCRLEPARYDAGLGEVGGRALAWCRHLADPGGP
jgi:hypothetical protein